ncbi:MAG: hypothetical protein WAZ94_00315 [Phycisphaerales bacterium]
MTRRTTPLFDLVSRGGAARPATPSTPRAAKPIVRVELKPGAAAYPEAAPQVQAGDALGGSGGIPANYWYLGGAVILLVSLLAWGGGVMFGRSQEQAKVQKNLGAAFGDRPSVTEPSPAGARPNSGQPQGPPRGQPQPQPQNQVERPQMPPTVPMSTGPVLSSRGMSADPRQKGLNYLNLASLPRTDAEGAIAFLSANGVEVAGVPVDPPPWAPKNQGPAQWYALYVTQGLTREQLGLDVRANLEAKVAQLGQVWQKQHRGSSNFSRPAWEKY